MNSLATTTRSLCFLLAGLLSLACATPDIIVESIEVTQAFQDGTNSVDLVSDRSTAVRVRVGTVGGGSASGVDGTLRVFVNGVELTPASGVSPINPGFSAPAQSNWDRDNEDHTLNFELAAPTGIPVSTDVDFVVELDALSGEPDVTNNTGRADDLTVVARVSPKLYYTRINYTPAGAGLPALADVQAGVGDMFVDGIYPVNDADPSLYVEGIFPTLSWSQDGNSNGVIDSDGEHSDVLDWLESCRQLIVDAEGNGDRIFLYGWVEGNPIDGNGWGRTGGRVAFGNTQHSRHQRTYAHELGHNFGLSHNSRTLSPDAGWDTGARLDGNPSTNNTTGRVKPSPLSDIMRGGKLSNEAWVDQTTYEYFLGHAVLDSASVAPDRGDMQYRPRVAAVSGVLTVDGQRLVRLNPVFRYPWLSQPSLNDPNGQYIARVRDDGGNIFEVTFNGLLGDDRDTPISTTFGFFAVRLPVPAERQIVQVAVIRREGAVELGTLERSAPPRVETLAPVTGDSLRDTVQVRFRVSDPDTPLDQIRVQVAYSNDGGTGWVPVAVNVPASAAVAAFSAAEIQNTVETGSGILRVIASDGLNTAFADVRRLTVRGGR